MLLNILVGISEVLKKKKRKEKEQKERGGQQKMWRSEMHIRGSFKKSERKQKKTKKRPRLSFGGWKMHMISFFVITCQKQHTGPSQII